MSVYLNVMLNVSKVWSNDNNVVTIELNQHNFPQQKIFLIKILFEKKTVARAVLFVSYR